MENLALIGGAFLLVAGIAAGALLQKIQDIQVEE